MAKSRKLSPKRTGTSIVTERRLAVLLSNWAKAADAAFSVKIAEMEDRLRQEFTVVVPPQEERAVFTPCSECDRPHVCKIILAGTQPCVHPDRRPELRAVFMGGPDAHFARDEWGNLHDHPDFTNCDCKKEEPSV